MTPDLHSPYVCQVCGYNMAGYLPNPCSFCGALKERFHIMEENTFGATTLLSETQEGEHA
jgi:hypothetical protein